MKLLQGRHDIAESGKLSSCCTWYILICINTRSPTWFLFYDVKLNKHRSQAVSYVLCYSSGGRRIIKCLRLIIKSFILSYSNAKALILSLRLNSRCIFHFISAAKTTLYLIRKKGSIASGTKAARKFRQKNIALH